MKSNSTTAEVSIVEVGPRDGLQNEAHILDLDSKLNLIGRLTDCGLTRIEAGAFVHPDRVPQMADSEAVFQQLDRRPGVRYSALVPNLKGLERARQLPVDEIAVFAAASEEFSRRNLNASIDESMARFRQVIAAAREQEIPARGYISCALGCLLSGRVNPELVAALAGQLADAGCYEICLADTIGVGTSQAMDALLDACTNALPMDKYAVHLHDTYGQALTNAKIALDRGVRSFDASVGGLGGCPFAPGASGNLATEDLVYMLEGAGFNTGIDLHQLAKLGDDICARLGHANNSRAGSAILRAGH